jgi:hypothetical protein
MSTFLAIILLLISVTCFLIGGFLFVAAKSAIHEIEGLILFLISAVCFVGFVIGATLVDIKEYFVKRDRKQ